MSILCCALHGAYHVTACIADPAAAHTEWLTCMSCPVVQSLRSKAEAGDKAAALELAEDDELFKPHMQPEELQRENRAKIRRVDPTVNLAADGFDRWSEGMTARDSSKVCTESVVGLRKGFQCCASAWGPVA